jgi:wyosine [tRNA(Phe)-imidazoG37] synthetase (radical SAM superfamily)
MKNYIFGPVPSRRLGRSLGIDLVPYKTCSYDCIYCQLGRTNCKTIERKEWAPLDAVLEELKRMLSTQPDYITLSGSGEPTLFSRIGELIDQVKTISDIPVAVLTNGSLLWQEDVRRQLSHADLVIPSLDAGNESLFHLVNRPHESISFDKMLDGLSAFRREYTGQYWLEVFVLNGYSASQTELACLRECIDRIRPDRVQLNTVTRPPAEDYAIGVSQERLWEIAQVFSPVAQVIVDKLPAPLTHESSVRQEDILELLSRRPCSTDEIAVGLGMHPNEVVKCVQNLLAQGLIQHSFVKHKHYYRVTGSASASEE